MPDHVPGSPHSSLDAEQPAARVGQKAAGTVAGRRVVEGVGFRLAE
jgi:hypothetical protein